MTTKFTPGPWRLYPAEYPDAGGYVEPRVFSILDPDTPKIICTMAVRDGDIELANGLMVAAAPEMYEALASLMKMIDDGLLVRDTSHDDESGWALKQLPLVRAVQVAQNALAKVVEP